MVHHFAGRGNLSRLGQEDARYGPITSLRNTYVGAPILVENLANDRGEVLFMNDVIINELAISNGIELKNDVSDGSRLVINDVLTGTQSDGIVDETGRLTGEYAKFVGTHGYELANTERPRAPVLQVE